MYNVSYIKTACWLNETKNVFACCYPTFPYCVVRDISAVYCEDRTKHTQCTGKVQYKFFNVKPVGAYNCHHARTVKYLEIKYDMLKIVLLHIIVEFMGRLD
jgi:hypothetical protein